MTTAIGLLSVRRSVYIAATHERIWEEFTSLERFRRWFGTGHELLQYEPWAGGMVELRVLLDGVWRHFGGRIAVFEPGRELSFEDNWIPEWNWVRPSQITFRLTPFRDGTVVELFHHGLEDIGPDFGEDHAGLEAGWDSHHLRALKAIVLAG